MLIFSTLYGLLGGRLCYVTSEHFTSNIAVKSSMPLVGVLYYILHTYYILYKISNIKRDDSEHLQLAATPKS